MELCKLTLKFIGQGKEPRKSLALLDTKCHYKIIIVIMTMLY